MEISNRSVGIVVATVIVIGMCVRSQTISYAEGASEANSQVAHLNPIPDSTFTQIVPIGGPIARTTSLGTPNSDLIKQDQSQVAGQNSAPPVASQPNSNHTAVTIRNIDSGPWSQDSYNPNASQGWQANSPIDESGNASDQELFDIATGLMNDNDRLGFRMTWASMSSQERQDFANELRGGN